MRRPTDASRLLKLMQRLGDQGGAAGRVYFTGGATAVLLGWRASTIDVDLKLEGGADQLLRVIPALKEELEINVELACPDDFIPELPGWRERSLHIKREGSLDFYHYDPYAQTLAKIERGHDLDLIDVREMITRGYVNPVNALQLLHQIEPELYRYPAIDPPTFRRKAEEALGQAI
jgi:hypothetical protein